MSTAFDAFLQHFHRPTVMVACTPECTRTLSRSVLSFVELLSPFGSDLLGLSHLPGISRSLDTLIQLKYIKSKCTDRYGCRKWKEKRR